VFAPLAVEEEVGTSDGTSRDTRYMVVPFQNEYLYAAYVEDEYARGKEDVVCTVPDLISILGEDGEALSSPELRYGLTCTIIGMPAHPLWSGSPQGLKVGGPEFFGLPVEYKSLGKYRQPKSVIDEFDSTTHS